MSTVFVETDPLAAPAVIAGEGVWSDVVVPTDDDPIDGASQGVAQEALANRDIWLRRRMVNGLEGGVYPGDVQFGSIVATGTIDAGGNITGLRFQYPSATNFNRTIEGAAYPDQPSVGTWAVNSSTTNWTTVGVVLSLPRLHIPLHFPHGCVIQSVTAWIHGPAAPNPPHAAFPGGKPIMPTFAVYSKTIATGVITLLVIQADLSASTGAYQADHALVANLLVPHTANRLTETYFAVLTGEGDASGSGGDVNLIGLVYNGGSVNYTATVASTE